MHGNRRAAVWLDFVANERQSVTVEVFDVLGRCTSVLFDGVVAAGVSRSLVLDASRLPGGVYLVRAQRKTFTAIQRVTVAR